MPTTGLDTQFTMVRGIRTELARGGQGQTVIFMHPGLGLFGSERFLKLLAARYEVVAPSHPGFGRSELPQWMSHIDDLAYFHLDLLTALDLRDVTLIGVSFGGWVAAEIAIKSTERIAQLVLVDALGIKIGDRETRDIADIYALPRSELDRRSFANPADKPSVAAMTDDDLKILAGNREAEALFGWAPYMHDPKLRRRLGRIQIPTLVVWGEQDGIVTPDYGRAFAEAIPEATFEVIEGAAHYAHIEQPYRLFHKVARFSATEGRTRALA